MLGKHHLLISSIIALLLVFPLILSRNSSLIIFGSLFFIFAAIGSLLPDADSIKGSELRRSFRYIDNLMQLLIPVITLGFQHVGYQKEWNHEIREEHRGLIHSPIGILTTSFVISLIVLIPLLILVLLGEPSYFLILGLIIFLGLMSGQFLHILEDSCTVSGINWKFPFGTKRVRGNIITKRERYPVLESPRQWSLIIIYIAIFLGVILLFDKLNLNTIFQILISSFIVILEILFMLFVGGVRFYEKTS